MAKKIKSKPKPKANKYDITLKINDSFENVMKVLAKPIKKMKKK
jgi:hypothetical protein